MNLRTRLAGLSVVPLLFGLGLQAANAESFLWHHRMIVRLSEALRQCTSLKGVADSLYVEATRRPSDASDA